MKLFTAFLFTALCLPHLHSQTTFQLTEGSPIMSFNIRYDDSTDGLKSWDVRRGIVLDIINKYKPGILGLQEALKQQVEYISEFTNSYAWVGVGRTDGKTKGEYCPIFYNTLWYCLIESGTFWLSETPEIAGSKSWDAAIERIVTWARFRLNDDFSLYIFNTHLDHIGKVSRLKSADLILNRINEIAGDNPVLLMGDFNVTEDDSVYFKITNSEVRKFFNAEETTKKKPLISAATFNAFGNENESKTIDYIFYSR
jgi:endonuclease/exonuclease/phosphatase family metal-dependent hydrolase